MSASLASLAVLLISELHVSLSLIISTLDAVMYTVPPLVDEALQEVKEAASRERVEGVSVMERNIPPPFTALHEVNVFVSAMVREDVEERVTEIAPPFDDVQCLNVTSEILSVASTESNSNTAPFPDSLLIEVNVFVPLRVSCPALTAISALLFVAYVELQLKVIPFNTREAVDMMERRERSLFNCAVSVIVNAFRVCTPALADSILSPLLILTMVDD